MVHAQNFEVLSLKYSQKSVRYNSPDSYIEECLSLCVNVRELDLSHNTYVVSLAFTLKITDSRSQKMCGECLISSRYVNKAVQKKLEMDSSKRHERQQPSSNYPVNYLSPKSKSARYANSRLQRHRLEKHIKKLYRRTKVELPQEQSAELCKLVESIEGSDVGKKELAKIYNEGNQYTSAKGG